MKTWGGRDEKQMIPNGLGEEFRCMVLDWHHQHKTPQLRMRTTKIEGRHQCGRNFAWKRTATGSATNMFEKLGRGKKDLQATISYS